MDGVVTSDIWKVLNRILLEGIGALSRSSESLIYGGKDE